MPEEPAAEKMENLLSEVENLKLENLLLKQEVDFQRKFVEHKEKVDERINRTGVQLGVVGLIVIGLAWIGISQEIGDLVKRRLDKKFSSQEIQAELSSAVNKAARELMQKRVIEFSDDEHHRFKCLIETQGKALFALRCRESGGQSNDASGACMRNGGEDYYEEAFPEINCEELYNAPTATRPNSVR